MSAARRRIEPGGWLGLLGGGQLGRLFCMAAQHLGYKVCVVDPAADSPAGAIAERHLQADYLDAAALAELATLCRAVTTEFENVPARALEILAADCVVAPAAASVAIAQDRVAEKRFIADCGIAVAPWQPILDRGQALGCDPALLPGLLKVARLGYDGKGQASVATPAEVCAAFERFGAAPCVLEQRLALDVEASVIVARGQDGQAVHFPVARNVHRDGILSVTTVPAGLPAAHEAQAVAAALRIAERLDYVGVLCVEFFLLADGRLLANEMAPRPHNSGHFSLDASVTSQFEQQARILAGLPLGATDSLCPAVMLNILGDAWFDAPAAGSAAVPARREPDWSGVLSRPRAKLHLYGKAEARRGRKMGHVTLLGDTLAAARADAAAIAPLVAQPPP